MPKASSPEALRRMQGQRRTGTKPELALRKLLHARGLRYRVDAPLPITGIRRSADLLFTRRRVAVFVDGCYWHVCPIHGSKPKSNGGWWAAKLKANVQRDRDTDRRLSELGWRVIRVWEHEDPADAAEQIESAVR